MNNITPRASCFKKLCSKCFFLSISGGGFATDPSNSHLSAKKREESTEKRQETRDKKEKRRKKTKEKREKKEDRRKKSEERRAKKEEMRKIIV
jgi:hypothetical protein